MESPTTSQKGRTASGLETRPTEGEIPEDDALFDPRRFAQARQEAEFTQQELAKEVARSEDAVRNYENGRNEPPGKIVKRIARATGWEPHWFVKGVEIDRAPSTRVEARPARSYDPDEPAVPPGLQRLIDMGLPLRRDELQVLVAYADPLNSTRGAHGAVGWTPGQWLDTLVEERRGSTDREK